MRTESGDDWSAFRVILKYFDGLMALIYFLLGVGIIWKADAVFNFPASYSIPLGAILMAYGLIRGYRTYQRSS